MTVFLELCSWIITVIHGTQMSTVYWTIIVFSVTSAGDGHIPANFWKW